jgi:hypothetical protein
MAEKSKNPIKKFVANFKHGQEMDARRTMLEEIFNDYYKKRRNVYKMNFIRGLFFGFGTFLGGTIVVAIVAALLSFFVELPFVGPSVEKAKDTIQSTQDN